MISKPELNRLNNMLGMNPNVGFAPDLYNLGGGERQPQYKWCWAPDLRYPAQCGTKQVRRYESDILTLPAFATSEPVYHMVPQLEDEVWALAHWEAPIGRDAWYSKYPDLKYPERGMYVITDVVLSPGVEPCEYANRCAVYAVTEKRVRNLNDFLEMAQARTDRAATRHKSDWEAMIDDAILPVVPGQRGGCRSQPLQIAKEFE